MQDQCSSCPGQQPWTMLLWSESTHHSSCLSPCRPTCEYIRVCRVLGMAGRTRLTAKPRHPGGHWSAARLAAEGTERPVAIKQRQAHTRYVSPL